MLVGSAVPVRSSAIMATGARDMLSDFSASARRPAAGGGCAAEEECQGHLPGANL
jgi:hypothetical protein